MGRNKGHVSRLRVFLCLFRSYRVYFMSYIQKLVSDSGKWFHRSGCKGELYISLFCSHCGHQRTVRAYCGDRTCPYCRNRMAARNRKRIIELVEARNLNSQKMALVTLTLLIKPCESLNEKYHKINQYFRNLRQSKIWQKVIKV